MLKIYKTINGLMTECETIEPDSWINLENPTIEEMERLTEELGIVPEFLYAALDEEETSHIDRDEGQTLIIVDLPYTEKKTAAGGGLLFSTMPLGIIISEYNIITVSLKENSIITSFINGRVRSVYTNMRTRFVLQIMYRMAKKYLQDLKQIDKASSLIEKELHVSMRNKELIQLLDLEKSLVFFSTSLKADESTIEKIMRGRVIRMYEEDEELVEDVLVEIKQAIEMSNIYSNILSGTMDAFASIISNNLNIVMKVMTSITILLAIPQVFAGLYGMNVSGLPFPNFWFVAGMAAVVVIIVAVILYKKKLF